MTAYLIIAYILHLNSHVRDNAPFNLAKRTTDYVSCPSTMKIQFSEFRSFLAIFGYPEHIISNYFS